MDDFEKKRIQALKMIDQGSKLEQLYTQEDFVWFLGWIESIRDTLKDKILKGDLITSQREEDHCKGGYKYLTDILEAAERFKEQADKGRKMLEKINKEEKKWRKEEGLDNEPTI